MSSCFGFRKSSRGDGDREPLLPVYDDDTSLQRATHQKLHTYQMLRALSKGFMPSTEQAVINLRTILSLDVLNPATPGLSDSGRKLAKYSKQLIQELIDLLKNKNDGDKLQDFIWSIINARVDVDTGDLIQTATSTKSKADAWAAYESVKTVGSLLLTNSDFRIFLSDLNTIGRQVFADTANTLSNVAAEAANQIEPSTQETAAITQPGADSEPVSKQDLEDEVAQVSHVITDGLKETGQQAGESLKENISGSQKEALAHRLKAAVAKLRKRTDYSDSVSTIGLLLQRYAKVYSRAVDNTITTVQKDVNTNDELDRAIKAGWSLVGSFGDRDAWEDLERKLDKVMEHSQKDPEFENMMVEVSASIQKMLTDPEFFDSAAQKLESVKEKSKEVGTGSPLRQDVDALVRQAHVVFDSVMNDEDVSKLLSTGLKIWNILFPSGHTYNPELLADTYSIFIPLLISAIQYIPIPRLEISVPEIDLLLENLILEPGRTINNSSFLPFHLQVQSYNDLSLRRARFGTLSTARTLVAVTLRGLSIRADDLGFWFRAHSGPLRFADSGIASFHLDDRGIDIALDIEIGRDRLEHILSLRNVRVRIHHLSYTLRQSRFSCLAWLLKPIIRPIIRRVLERRIASSVAEFFHAANRELLFARERLRATRISDPADLATFVRAVVTRLTPAEDPDLYVNIGVEGGARERGGVFGGVYAPGSVVKLWDEEARRAGEVVEDNAEVRGWRNGIFDVQGVDI